MSSTEAPFNTEEATKKWQRKIELGHQVNLFRFTKDLMRIHLGADWQNIEGLRLLDEESDRVFNLRYFSEPGHYSKRGSKVERIVVNGNSGGIINEVLHFHHYVDAKGKDRFSAWIRVPPVFSLMAGGNKITKDYFRKVNLIPDTAFALVINLWQAHEYTLSIKQNEQLPHLQISGLPAHITN